MKQNPNKSTTYRINPCVTCQPLGAVYAAIGFYHTLPLVHGSQGCVAYLRSQIIRSYREQVLTATTSLSEDAAVYGGKQRLLSGVEHECALYNPEMIPVFTTCLSETIGDDVSGILKSVKEFVEADVIPISTASYKGDNLSGFDHAIKGIVEYYFMKYKGEMKDRAVETATIITGFVGPGDMRSIKKIVNYFSRPILISDVSNVLCSPTYDEYGHYTQGGTTKSEIMESFSSGITIILQKYSMKETREFYKKAVDRNTEVMHLPIGLRLTDQFIYTLSKVYNRPIPESLLKERKELVEGISKCKNYLYGKNVVIYENPDIAYGLASMCIELGMYPVIIASSREVKEFENDVEELIKEIDIYGFKSTVYNGVDHYEVEQKVEELHTNDIKIDFMFGNSKAKYMCKSYGISLVRVGFPITDRLGAQRLSLQGYNEMLHMAEQLANIYIEQNDKFHEGVI